MAIVPNDHTTSTLLTLTTTQTDVVADHLSHVLAFEQHYVIKTNNDHVRGTSINEQS